MCRFGNEIFLAGNFSPQKMNCLTAHWEELSECEIFKMEKGLLLSSHSSLPPPMI